jgi:hypothetical protein
MLLRSEDAGELLGQVHLLRHARVAGAEPVWRDGGRHTGRQLDTLLRQRGQQVVAAGAIISPESEVVELELALELDIGPSVLPHRGEVDRHVEL